MISPEDIEIKRISYKYHLKPKKLIFSDLNLPGIIFALHNGVPFKSILLNDFSVKQAFDLDVIPVVFDSLESAKDYCQAEFDKFCIERISNWVDFEGNNE